MCIDFSIFFFKQKTAYEMRISDWSSDVCSSDLWRRCGEHRFRTYTIYNPTKMSPACSMALTLANPSAPVAAIITAAPMFRKRKVLRTMVRFLALPFEKSKQQSASSLNQRRQTRTHTRKRRYLHIWAVLGLRCLLWVGVV